MNKSERVSAHVGTRRGDVGFYVMMGATVAAAAALIAVPIWMLVWVVCAQLLVYVVMVVLTLRRLRKGRG